MENITIKLFTDLGRDPETGDFVSKYVLSNDFVFKISYSGPLDQRARLLTDCAHLEKYGVTRESFEQFIGHPITF